MVDRLAWLRRRAEVLPPVAVDAVIAVLCYLATVALPVKVAREGGWSLFVLAAVASVPLAWRRRQPVVVAALVGAGTLGLAITGALGGIPLPYGQLVATYTVASLAAPVWRLLVMVATCGGVVVSVLLLLRQGPASLALATLPFVVAYALGMLEERTRRLPDAQQVTAARERERIAREIHDIVAHSVSLMVVQAEAGLVLAADTDPAAKTFDTISATGREALTQLDRALGVLRGDGPTRRPPPGPDDVPELVDRARLAGLDAELTVHGRPRPVPADLATAVYRLVQEAVTNSVRHAEASRLDVRLDWQDAAVRIEVSDDGHGPTLKQAVTGRGLVGMRERVQAFGGELHTGAGEGGTGFRITAVLPLPGASTIGSGGGDG